MTLKIEDSPVDYEVGDWVETCDLLPGIVQQIDYKHDNVSVFYPHYAFQYPGEYGGGSQCSIYHCGVHKITPQYACKLLAIGREKLKVLWNEMCETGTYDWEVRVEKCYDETIKKRYDS